ncbi:MAG: arylsulfatase [Planctomycetota bacterium]
MNRRNFIKAMGIGITTMALTGCNRKASTGKPNIIFIMADDLGYAELGCYGQKKIKTPNIDKLAAEGMKFTQHYSGSPVCAPSRCSLMTGLHCGHGQVRNNKQVGGKEAWEFGATTGGQYPLSEGTVTVAKILKDAGYVTGAFGKWGLGRVNTSGDPQKQGFDHFYGYICQRQAHTYYPNHLWDDGKVVRIPENEDGKEVVYSHDLIAEKALEFIKDNKDRPFFCYVPFTIPHLAVHVPEDSLSEYRGKWPDPPYDGSKGYFPHPAPRAGYAAMITRMDRDVGKIIETLKKLGIDDNTLVIFTSDNGPSFHAGGSDSVFFESTGPLRGLKGTVYEGGIRVPFIARWRGMIKQGAVSDHVSAFWDFLPTCAELVDVNTALKIDGVSMLPVLLGELKKQKRHQYLYWELGGRQGIRMGDWKAVMVNQGKIELYNLKSDIGEQKDVADESPQVAEQMQKLFITARTESKIFPLRKARKREKR